jgi:hypothetical protein
MSYRDLIVYVGSQELTYLGDNPPKPASMKESPDRVLEYFEASTGHDWTFKNALTQSWCGHFVYWVLSQAEVEPIPSPGGKTIGRFMSSQGGLYPDYSVSSGDYEPQAGDLYYQRFVNGKETHHIGIIMEVYDDEIVTIDGNSGPDNGEGFYLDPVTWKPRLGSGMIYSRSKKKSKLTSYIQMPD